MPLRPRGPRGPAPRRAVVQAFKGLEELKLAKPANFMNASKVVVQKSLLKHLITKMKIKQAVLGRFEESVALSEIATRLRKKQGVRFVEIVNAFERLKREIPDYCTIERRKLRKPESPQQIGDILKGMFPRGPKSRGEIEEFRGKVPELFRLALIHGRASRITCGFTLLLPNGTAIREMIKRFRFVWFGIFLTIPKPARKMFRACAVITSVI